MPNPLRERTRGLSCKDVEQNQKANRTDLVQPLTKRRKPVDCLSGGRQSVMHNERALPPVGGSLFTYYGSCGIFGCLWFARRPRSSDTTVII